MNSDDSPEQSQVALAPGSEKNGLACMLADLLRQNLRDKPAKRADFGRISGRVTLVAEDAEVSLTLEFCAGRVVVHHGVVGLPDVTLRADSETVINLSLLEVGRLGLPSPRGKAVRTMAEALRQGRLRVYGALANLPMLLRLIRLMSVN